MIIKNVKGFYNGGFLQRQKTKNGNMLYNIWFVLDNNSLEDLNVAETKFVTEKIYCANGVNTLSFWGKYINIWDKNGESMIEPEDFKKGSICNISMSDAGYIDAIQVVKEPEKYNPFKKQ
jgi:hypothetical protein